MMLDMTDTGNTPGEENTLGFKVPDRGPRPWDFDLDNLPEEFTPEIVGRLTLDEMETLEAAALNPRQRESFDEALAEILKPAAEAARKALAGLQVNNRIAETVQKALQQVRPAWTDQMQKAVRASHPQVDLRAISTENERRAGPLRLITQQPNRLPPPLPPRNTMLLDLAEEREQQYAAEQERAARERQTLEFMGQSVTTQLEMLNLQKTQADESKTDRKLEWAVLIVAIIGVLVSLTAVITTIAVND